MKFSVIFIAMAAALPAIAGPAAAPEPAVGAELIAREAEPVGLEKRDTSIYVCQNTLACSPLRSIYCD